MAPLSPEQNAQLGPCPHGDDALCCPSMICEEAVAVAVDALQAQAAVMRQALTEIAADDDERDGCAWADRAKAALAHNGKGWLSPAQAEELRAQVAAMRAALAAVWEDVGGHDEDCPGDDTCACAIVKQVNEAMAPDAGRALLAERGGLRETARAPAEFDPAKPCIWDLVCNDALEQFARSSTICRLVIEDMRAKDAAGATKYGTRLQANNGRDPLVDTYQELLDAAVYARQALYEQRASQRAPHELQSLYRRIMAALFDTRELIERRHAGAR